jgi:hypothetical protein
MVKQDTRCDVEETQERPVYYYKLVKHAYAMEQKINKRDKEIEATHERPVYLWRHRRDKQK